MPRENAESSLLRSDGAHLAETQQVVEEQNCDSKTDATQRAQTTATQESEDCNRCSDTHHAMKKLEIQVILTPKSLDIQLRKRIQDGYDLGCVKEICMPRKDIATIVIAHCRDYAIEWSGHNDSATLTAEFQQLYDHWIPGKYRVKIYNFSFKYEMNVLMELLNAATIFYMSGVHGQAGHTPMNVATEHVQQIIAALKRKVQSNEIVYWGVCGGAMLAGKSTTFVHTPFNLLEGTNVFYDGGISAKSCEMKTHAAKNILQITTGCAIAVRLTTNKDSCRAVSFPCIKNKAQWHKFAAESTRALHEWLEVKAHAGSHRHLSNASTGTAAMQEGKDSIQCGDTHPTVSVLEISEEIPHESLGTCSAGSQLQREVFNSRIAQIVLGFEIGIRLANDAKIREQLFYAVTNQAELIDSITNIDEHMSTSGLSGPWKDLFEGPLSQLLSKYKNHQEMISVLTQLAAQASLHIPTDSHPKRSNLHPIITSDRGDTHPTEKEGTLPPSTPPTRPPPPLPFTPPPNFPIIRNVPTSLLPFNPPLYSPTIKSIFQHYNAGCLFNKESQQWAVPETHHLDLINQFPWTKMLHCGDEFPLQRFIVSTVPTFYLDEPDHNHHNKPRLDIVLTFNDGETVRYHPRAHHIWSSTEQPTRAMLKRYNLHEKLKKIIEKAQR